MRSDVTRAVLVVFFLAPALACGGGGGGGESSSSSPAKATTAADPIDACNVLTADLLKSVFDIGDAEVTFRPGSSSANPSCEASWPAPNAAEAEAESAKAMQEYMKAKIAGKKDLGPMPIAHTSHSVRLTLAGMQFDDPASAQSAFQGIIASLREGVTAEAEVDGKKQSHTFTVNYDHEVGGVGEGAAWAPKLKQLSFVSGAHIAHVNVNLGDAELNEQKAVELAKAVSGALQ